MSELTEIHVIFDGPPGPVSGRFVECEDGEGRSINAGEWKQRPDGLWALTIKLPAASAPAGATVADYEEVLADHRRLVRELDVLLNGEAGAAKQASLCDIVAQVARERRAPAASAAGPASAWVEVTDRLMRLPFPALGDDVLHQAGPNCAANSPLQRSVETACSFVAQCEKHLHDGCFWRPWPASPAKEEHHAR